MSQRKSIEDLPVLRELESSEWGGDFPWVTEDLFQREYQGLLATPWGDLVAYRNEDVSALMKHPSVTHQTLDAMVSDFTPPGAPVDRGVSGMMLVSSFSMRPPDHRPLKQLTAAPLAPASLSTFRNEVRKTCVQALTEASSQPTVDWVAEVTKPVVAKVWSTLVGLTAEEGTRFIELQNEDVDLLNNQHSGDELAKGNADADEYMDALTEALRRSHSTGKFPLLNGLVDAHGAMGELGRPTDVFRTFASTLADGFIALPGMLSTVAMGVPTYEIDYPEVDLDSWAVSTFSELARLHAAVVSTFRQAGEDFDFQGVHVPKDTNIWMMWLFANRDPSVFPEPLAFDLERPGRRKQVTFGGGAYSCTGQNVSRLVCEEMLKALALTRASLRLEGAPEWGTRPMNHELRSLRLAVSLP